jgi:hypothetical protein
VTDRCSGDVVACGKFSGCCEAAGMTTLTMRAQAAALADIGRVALGFARQDQVRRELLKLVGKAAVATTGCAISRSVGAATFQQRTLPMAKL